MASAEVSAVVNHPVEKVFRFIADLENDPKWHPRCVESKRLTDGQIGVGTRYLEVYRFMGQAKFEMEITEFEPNRKVAFAGTPSGGMVPMSPRDVLTVAPEDGGTRVTYSTNPRVRGPFMLLTPLLSMMAKNELKRIMARLGPALDQAGR